MITTLIILLSVGIPIQSSGELVKRQASCARSKYRPIDGSCNNLNNPQWGQTATTFARFLPPHYSDTRTTPRVAASGRELPGARIVSLNLVRDVDDEHETASHMLMQWGQFINHDMTKKRTQSDNCCDDGRNPALSNAECMAIMVPPGDAAFRQKRCLGFTRSASVIVNGVREQINDVTGFVDASPVYGSTQAISRSLREFRGGRLRSSSNSFGKELLPTKQSDTSSVDSGDTRTNMISSLVSVHVLLLRLHNQLAGELSQLNPQWNDETLYQEARRILVAVVQQITYSELLPAILGSSLGNLRIQDGHFNGYDPSLNPSVDNAFAVAAYRFGHSLVRSRLARFTPDLAPLPAPPLSSEFFNVSSIMRPGAVDSVVIGLLNQKCQRADSNFSPEIHHRLFSVDGTGADLYAINIQRGRDHGVPGYVFWRQMCGLSTPRNFQDLSGVVRPDALRAMERVYENVQDVDLYAGGMAEVSSAGGMVGPTFACIIGRQFDNSKRGDRFWFENSGQPSSFTADQLREIKKMTLARIVCDTTEQLRRAQPQAMRVAGPSNPLVSCENIPELDLRPWIDRPSRFQEGNQLDQRPQNLPPGTQVVFRPPIEERLPQRINEQLSTPAPIPTPPVLRRPVLPVTPRPSSPFTFQSFRPRVNNQLNFSRPVPNPPQFINTSPRPNPFRTSRPISNLANNDLQAVSNDFFRDSSNIRVLFNDPPQGRPGTSQPQGVALRVPGLSKDGVERGPFGFVIRF